jgi:hypothetical protein
MSATLLVPAGLLLAKAKTGEALKAGPIWFAVVLLLGIACYFLFKSMSKHLRAVRDDFPVDPARPPAAAQPTTPEPPTTLP